MWNKRTWSTFATRSSNTPRAISVTILAAIVALFSSGSLVSGQGNRKTADVVGQGMAGSVVSPDGGSTIRTSQGITVSVSMPTPAPFSYAYPPPNAFQGAVFQGAPEVFTGWAFVFNNPTLCSAPCDGNDLGNTPAQGGVYNFAGHVVGGSHLQLDGYVSVGEGTFAGVPLQNPLGAAVHLAVAPHGTLQPAALPTQINYPIGNPAFWWVAILQP